MNTTVGGMYTCNAPSIISDQNKGTDTIYESQCSARRMIDTSQSETRERIVTSLVLSDEQELSNDVPLQGREEEDSNFGIPLSHPENLPPGDVPTSLLSNPPASATNRFAQVSNQSASWNQIPPIDRQINTIADEPNRIVGEISASGTLALPVSLVMQEMRRLRLRVAELERRHQEEARRISSTFDHCEFYEYGGQTAPPAYSDGGRL